MRKHHHTRQTSFKISQLSNYSQRSLIGRTRGIRPAMTASTSQPQPENEQVQANTPASDVAPLNQWEKEDDNTIHLSDEISSTELKAFSFGCIETLASLKPNQGVSQALTDLINKKLIHLKTLTAEYHEAQNEHQQAKAWSKKFVASVQPLIISSTGPTEQKNQLADQALQCVERSIATRFRMDTLRKRLDFLVESVPDFVSQTVAEMKLPVAMNNQLTNCVKKVLTSVAK